MHKRSRFRISSLVLALGLLAVAFAQPPATESGFVYVEGDVRLYYQRYGTGTPTVFIPNRHELVASFASLLHFHDVVTWDPRGRGLSDRPTESGRYGIDAELADAEALRRHFGAERVVYVGVSLWGNLGILYAARHPESVAGVVALGPLGIAQGLMRGSLKRPTPNVTPQRVELARMRADGRIDTQPYAFCVIQQFAEFADSYWDPAAMAPLLAANLCQYANEQPSRLGLAIDGMFRSFGFWDWRADAEAVEAPVLLLFGEHEKWRTDSVIAYADHLRDVGWLEVERAGHHVHNDRPDVVIPMMDAFFRGQWPEGLNR
jgi:pimeloyl-ACP methyl ester carboxylesterase